MKQRLLLLACSMTKAQVVGKVQAQNLYRGNLFMAGFRFAKAHNLKILILSAKYGFIEPTAEVEYYDQKMKDYEGPWPKGEGWFVGGLPYFGNAPERFQPLIPPGLPYGRMVSHLQRMLRTNTPPGKTPPKEPKLKPLF